MRKVKLHFFLFIIICIYSTLSHAQKLPSTEDSIKTLICKKWEVDHARFGSEVILRGPTAPQMFFEFKNDKTFVMEDKEDSEVIKGTWKYDSKKGVVNLSQTNRSNFMSIVAAQEAKIILKVNETKNAPPDIGEMELILKENK